MGDASCVCITLTSEGRSRSRCLCWEPTGGLSTASDERPTRSGGHRGGGPGALQRLLGAVPARVPAVPLLAVLLGCWAFFGDSGARRAGYGARKLRKDIKRLLKVPTTPIFCLFLPFVSLATHTVRNCLNATGPDNRGGSRRTVRRAQPLGAGAHGFLSASSLFQLRPPASSLIHLFPARAHPISWPPPRSRRRGSQTTLSARAAQRCAPQLLAPARGLAPSPRRFPRLSIRISPRMGATPRQRAPRRPPGWRLSGSSALSPLGAPQRPGTRAQPARCRGATPCAPFDLTTPRLVQERPNGSGHLRANADGARPDVGLAAAAVHAAGQRRQQHGGVQRAADDVVRQHAQSGRGWGARRGRGGALLRRGRRGARGAEGSSNSLFSVGCDPQRAPRGVTTSNRCRTARLVSR